jgi:uncharacterized membrane protein YedE/YeeE
MMRAVEPGRAWSPYLAGALAGLLIIASVWVAGKYLGASTTFVKSAGMIEQAFGSERVAKMAYFIKEAPQIDWQWMFVVGIFLGSLAASLSDRSFKLQATPDMWQDRFGPGKGKRWLTAFAGGLIAMYGARLADGCPSGHGLSGSLQLAASGLIALVCFFVGGMVIARLLYGKERSQ